MRQRYIEDRGLYPDDIATKCANSIKIKDLDFRVPCGKCIPCKRKRRADWTLRLEHEYLGSDSAVFITLTYNEQSVPRTKEGVPTLYKKHVQNYIKRLRNEHVKYVSTELNISKKEVKEVSKPLRYFAVGEYGTKTRRPHYHIILFNMEVGNIGPITDTWKNTETGNNLGFVDIGTVTSASINYVTKYMFKNFNRKTDWRNPPFNLMSKGRRFEKDGVTPAKYGIIGNYYLQKYGTWHIANEQLSTRDQKGTTRRLPKAYLHRLFTDKQDRIRLSRENFNKYIDKKLKKYNKQKETHYNSEVSRILKSKDSDYQRELNRIINLETL